MHYEGFYKEQRRLKNAYDGIGDATAETILTEFGGIEGLHETTLDEFTSVSGLGPGTADKIGIWDDEGRPVDTVTENPCPVCRETYDMSSTSRSVPLDDEYVDWVCMYTEYDSDSVTAYIHLMD